MTWELGSEGLLQGWPYTGEKVHLLCRTIPTLTHLPPGPLTSKDQTDQVAIEFVCCKTFTPKQGLQGEKNEESGQPWAAGTRRGLLGATG